MYLTIAALGLLLIALPVIVIRSVLRDIRVIDELAEQITADLNKSGFTGQ